jgi:DNA-binding NtrC family response regulator
MARPSVLVVDDDDAIRSYLTHLLTARGYAVDAVEATPSMPWIQEPPPSRAWPADRSLRWSCSTS